MLPTLNLPHSGGVTDLLGLGIALSLSCSTGLLLRPNGGPLHPSRASTTSASRSNNDQHYVKRGRVVAGREWCEQKRVLVSERTAYLNTHLALFNKPSLPFHWRQRAYSTCAASIPEELAQKLKEVEEREAKRGKSLILPNASKEYFQLTPSEKKLFELLKRVVEGEEVALRVAGGWVRDKLLGLKSEDVDVSIDTLSGVALSKRLEAYLQTIGEEEMMEISAKKEPTNDSFSKSQLFTSDPSTSKGCSSASDPLPFFFSLSSSPSPPSSQSSDSSSQQRSSPSSQSSHPSSSQSFLPQSTPQSTSTSTPRTSFTKLNPLQSKHLETAIVTLYGIELNFAQLRTDVYDKDSRIPQIKLFGTSSGVGPSEDAFRRDFSINALFYNIMTDSIEDYTGMALSHLRGKVINTPLPPIETLQDDPLRALRAVRFAARFGFSLGQSLQDAISDQEVHQMLLTKVTAPRIGIEVQKMLSPSLPHLTPHNPALFQSLSSFPILQLNNPLHAIDLLYASQLHLPIFNTSPWILHDSPSVWTHDMASRGRVLCYCWDAIYRHIDSRRWEGDQPRPTPHLRSALFALIFLSPLLSSSYHGVQRNSLRGKFAWVDTFKHCLQYPLSHIFFGAQAIADAQSVSSIINDMLNDSQLIKPSLKREGESSSLISDTFSMPSSDTIQAYSQAFSEALRQEDHREKLGLWLRNATPFWRSQILFSRPLLASSTGSLDFPNDTSDAWIQSNFQKELGLIDAIEKSDFEQVRLFKPFFNGHQLGKILNLKPGPTLGEALKRQLSYQIVHREASESDVKEMLLSSFPPLPPHSPSL